MPEFYDQEEDQEKVDPHPFPKQLVINADYRSMGPTMECPCGNDGFYILATFDDDRSVAGYFTDALCAECGALLKAPTQADVEMFPKPIDYEDLIEPPMNIPGWDGDPPF